MGLDFGENLVESSSRNPGKDEGAKLGVGFDSGPDFSAALWFEGCFNRAFKGVFNDRFKGEDRAGIRGPQIVNLKGGLPRLVECGSDHGRADLIILDFDTGHAYAFALDGDPGKSGSRMPLRCEPRAST